MSSTQILYVDILIKKNQTLRQDARNREMSKKDKRRWAGGKVEYTRLPVIWEGLWTTEAGNLCGIVYQACSLNLENTPFYTKQQGIIAKTIVVSRVKTIYAV